LIIGWYFQPRSVSGKWPVTEASIQSLGQLKISEGFGTSEGNSAIQYLPLFAKGLEIFGKSVFGVLVAWEGDGIPALQQRLIPL
jgi:hypothetical protein